MRRRTIRRQSEVEKLRTVIGDRFQNSIAMDGIEGVREI
jgi:hypothetical protein